VVAMQSDADRGEVTLRTLNTTLRLCFFQPPDAETELIALLAERLPRERVSTGPSELPSNARSTGAAELPSGAVGAGRPLEAWRLTAPESYLLRYAEHGPLAAEAFALALKELVARRALRVKPATAARKWVPGAKSVWLLTEGPKIGSVTASALTPVLELFQQVQGRHSRVAVSTSAPDVELEGVVLRTFVMAAARNSDGFQRYLQRDVEGSLAHRGLLVGSGRFRHRAQHTVAGRRANDDLGRWLDEGQRCLARRARAEDPGRAFDYLRRAGAAVLLIHNADAALGDLDGVLRTGTVDERALYGPIIDRATYHTPDTDSDLWAPDSAVTALEGIESAFGAIDAAIDAATFSGGS
jgi:hypothetical protein